MTYSIIGYDAQTKEIGIGVHSKLFNLGNMVPWIKAEVGAIATQSLVNVSLGPIGLGLLEDGRDPKQIIDHFKEIDDGIELRQLGIFSINHGFMNFTGKECIEWAGGRNGSNYSCQGNILTGANVIEDMANGFESTEGTLINKIMSAMEAAESAGGDARGSQSAAILIHQKDKGRAGYGDVKVDLKVEDHDNPIKEMRRLVEIYSLYAFISETTVKYETDIHQAIQLIEERIEGQISREFDEAWLHLATLYFAVSDKDQAKICLDRCLAIHPGMSKIIKYYPKLQIGFDDAFLKTIIGGNND